MSRRGLYGNALYTAWSSLLGLIAVPALIRALGIEAYGVIGLLLTAQAVLLALDLGLSAAVNRYVARYVANSKLSEARDLLASLSPIYLAVGLLVLAAGSAVAPWITLEWLALVSLPPRLVMDSLTLISAVIAVRWMSALYQATLIGAGRVDLSSRIGLVAVTCAQLGGVLVALASGELRYYFVWILLCAFGQLLALRTVAWRVLAHTDAPRRRWSSVRSVYRFSLAMGGVSITGMILVQSDKLLLSRSVALDAFALYSLVWTLASGLYVILTPTFNVIAPRFAGLIAIDEVAILRSEYRHFSRVFSATLFPVVAGGIIAGGDILAVFTGDQNVAVSGHAALVMLLLGTAMNGVMHFPYSLQLASGRGDIALATNVLLCAIFLPTLLVLVNRYGVVGAASAWCLINALYLVIGSIATRLLIPHHPSLLEWAGGDLLPSFLLTAIVMSTGSWICRSMGITGWMLILVTAALALLTIALSLRLFAGLRIADLRSIALDAPDHDSPREIES